MMVVSLQSRIFFIHFVRPQVPVSFFPLHCFLLFVAIYTDIRCDSKHSAFNVNIWTVMLVWVHCRGVLSEAYSSIIFADYCCNCIGGLNWSMCESLLLLLWYLYPCSWLYVHSVSLHVNLVVVIVFVRSIFYRLFNVLFTFDSLLSMLYNTYIKLIESNCF